MLFRQLEYLVALSRERHFTRAAEACAVSQPALSEAIRKLEIELDLPLIVRGHKFEGLTAEGVSDLTLHADLLSVVDATGGYITGSRCKVKQPEWTSCP